MKTTTSKARTLDLLNNKIFDWICPNCLKQLYTDSKKMFCKICNIEYDESEEGIKKYCSDFEERMLKEIEWTGSIFPTSLVS